MYPTNCFTSFKFQRFAGTKMFPCDYFKAFDTINYARLINQSLDGLKIFIIYSNRHIIHVQLVASILIWYILISVLQGLQSVSVNSMSLNLKTRISRYFLLVPKIRPISPFFMLRITRLNSMVT